MQATDLLQRAAELMAERGQQYDKPEGERSMGRAAAVALAGHKAASTTDRYLRDRGVRVVQAVDPGRALRGDRETTPAS